MKMEVRQISLIVTVCVAVGLLSGLTCAEENYQAWSEQSYLDEPYSFTCNDSLEPVFLNRADQLTWRRHGHDAALVNDDHFELAPLSGIQNMQLTMKKVTDEMAGIYFCEIRTPSGDFVARVVKGLNIGGHKYHDTLDKYRRKLVVGVIVGASMLFLIVSVCAVDHFRYQSDEERREKREAKEERIRRRQELKNGGHDNLGMDMTTSGIGSSKYVNDHHGNNINGLRYEVNTQV